MSTQSAHSNPLAVNQPESGNRNSDSVERMVQINEKLKAELLEVITKMDGQIRKFEDKRRAKIESELKTNAAL